MFTDQYLEWCDSEMLSDVTIHYGERGELIFFGHRVVLCKSSGWFRRAFLGPFAEAESKEITLHDDDPAHLLGMLSCCYEDFSGYCLKDASPGDPYEAVMWVLGLHVVADKYEVQTLKRMTAASLEHVHLPHFLNSISLKDLQDPAKDESQIRDIVKAAYALVGQEARDTIQKTVSTQLLQHKHTTLLGRYGNLTHVSIRLMDEVPEFGRDLCLGLVAMQAQDHPAKKMLHIAEWIKCPGCHYAWPKVDGYKAQRCPKLGCGWYSGCLKIVVKTLSNTHFTIYVDSSATIDDVKSKIKDHEGTPGGAQRLVYKRRPLEDGYTLADYDFQSGQNIYLTLRC